MEETTTRGQVSRRTVAKGMAWAAPAIPVVAMAPMAAASPIDEDCVQINLDGECKNPGAPDFSYDLEVCNTCLTGSFTLISVGKSNGSGLSESPNPDRGVVWEAPEGTIVNAGECFNVPLLYSTNSGAQLDIVIQSGGQTIPLNGQVINPCQ